MAPRSFWEDIFGQLNQPQPQYLDQSVGAEPTATERGGLLGSIVGTMWNDPIALAGFNSNVIDWNRNTSTPERGGEYYFPDSTETPDTVRFGQGGLGALRMPAPPAQTPINGPAMSYPAETMTRTARYLPQMERPDFPLVGRHEFRHRGMALLPAAARAYGVPYHEVSPNARLSEEMNVFQDRQLNFPESYGGLMEFSPQDTQMYGALLERLRATADQVNAARVQWLYAHPGMTWSDAP